MEAGFPQPIEDEVNTGRFWYQADGDMICYGFSVADFGEMATNEGCVFAPTATDILRELPNKILFWKYENIFVCGAQIVGDNDYYTIQFETVYKDENPAEACALAWLELKKK